MCLIPTVNLLTQNHKKTEAWTGGRTQAAVPTAWLLLGPAHVLSGSNPHFSPVQTGNFQEHFQCISLLLNLLRINSFCMSPRSLINGRPILPKPRCFKHGLILVAARLPLRQKLKLIKGILAITWLHFSKDRCKLKTLNTNFSSQNGNQGPFLLHGQLFSVASSCPGVTLTSLIQEQSTQHMATEFAPHTRQEAQP